MSITIIAWGLWLGISFLAGAPVSVPATDFTLDPAWIALIGTLCGGIGLKVVEKWLSKNDTERTNVRADVQDLINRLDKQQERIDRLEEEVTFWRNAFYKEQERAEVLNIQLIQNGLTPTTKKVDPPT